MRLFSRSSGGGAGGIAAKDALGNDVKAAEWLKTHLKGDHSLAQGLKVCTVDRASTSRANDRRFATSTHRVTPPT